MREIFSNTDNDVARYLAKETQIVREYIYAKLHIDIDDEDPIIAEYLILNAFAAKIHENIQKLNEYTQETEALLNNTVMDLMSNAENQQANFNNLTESIKNDFASASDKILEIACKELKSSTLNITTDLTQQTLGKLNFFNVYLLLGTNLIMTLLLCIVILFK